MTLRNTTLKKITALLLLFLFIQLRTASQHKASITDEPLKLGDGLIVTNAQWAATTNPLVYYLGSKRSLWVTDKEIDKWLKSYNKQKGTDYVFVNRSIDPNKVVLATEQSAKAMSAKASANDPGEDFRTDMELNDNFAAACQDFFARVGREFLFLENGCYKFPLKTGVNYKQNPLFNVATLYTNSEKGNDVLNGKASVRIYDSVEKITTAHYRGQTKNGMPDGYGLYVRRQEDCQEGFVRKGFWKDGVFTNENEMNALQEELKKIVLENEATSNLNINIEEASFNKDPFLPGTTTGYKLIVYYTWNIGEKNRQLRVCLCSLDFNASPEITILDKDGWSEIYFVRMKRSQAQNAEMNKIFGFAKKTAQDIAARNTTYYDDYLRYYIPNWTYIGGQWNGDIGYGDITDVTNIYIDVRDKRSSDWQEAGRIKIFRKKSTTFVEDINTDAGSFMGHQFKYTYRSAGEIIKEVIPIIKSKYPNPSFDNSNEKKEELIVKNVAGINKIGLVKKRLLQAHLFDFTNSDTLQGIWMANDEMNIIDRTSSRFYNLNPLRSEKMPYQMSLFDYYYEIKGKELMLFEVRRGKRVDTKKYIIKSIKKDEITFEDGTAWQRAGTSAETKRSYNILYRTFDLDQLPKYERDTAYYQSLNAIKELTKDESSAYYYPRLLSRFSKYDASLTSNELAALLIGFTATPEFGSKYVNYLDSMLLMIKKEKAGQMREAKLIGEKLLVSHPFYFETYTQLNEVYASLGLTAQAKQSIGKAVQIVEAVSATGDGSRRNPWLQIDNQADEYYLQIKKINIISNDKLVDIVTGLNDNMKLNTVECTDENGNPKTFYFYVTDVFNRNFVNELQKKMKDKQN